MLAETLRRISVCPQFGTDDYRLWLEQSDFIEFLEANKSEEEVVLYAGTSAFIYCILVPLKALNPLDVTDLMGWSCNPTASWGISCTYSGTGKRPKVWISPPLDGCGSKTLAKGEQLLFLRQFDGRYEDQSYFEVSPKLTHAHDLHYVPERKAFCRFDDNGDIDDIIRITTFGEGRFDHGSTIVTIKRDVLDLHLALTNSALVQLFDSTRYSPGNFGGWGQHPEKTVEAWDKQLFYRVGVQRDNASYLRGFQILTMNQPREKLLRQAAEWDDNTEKQYATFIAHDWRYGVVRELSCDPRHLANYFESIPLI